MLQKGDDRILFIDAGIIGVFRAELGVLDGVGVGGVEVIEETVEVDLAHQVAVSEVACRQLDGYELVIAAEGVAAGIAQSVCLNFSLYGPVQSH